ncbi:enoyl-CoA hydratase-related protein [Piscirickettsia salmonis]|nr:enoyl-CoA hydratase-related protein [Piscirickettsia salmonis]AKP74125.1 enoyl-CoA hydratase [Piscirickettsia salmonis LF-89 = ATCC VR-1361]ALY02945.1 enoyl-CoA hydratase [Piscirickettsia salmonis]AMA42501.1 enoyl-CoA hydratase [Piscirickettsia salmonis]AOS34971.1 enoyl-CoA hydratase [Piscirickettsia salmonis]APS59680.1 enoyl-CoA hydratase [Piscirickettsia salmonis]
MEIAQMDCHSYIQRKLENNILTLQINRPDKKNAINQQMYQTLVTELDIANQDDTIKAILFTGTADTFTSGNDLNDFAKLRSAEDLKDVVNFLHRISTHKKPLIAAVNGLAIGIGTTLLLHCDLAFSTTESRFQLPFIHLGLCPEGASSVLLAQATGYKKAAELLMTGKAFTGQEALEMNIINQLFPKETLLEKTHEYLDILAQQPIQALQITKQLLKRPQAQSITETIEVECAHFINQLQNKETQTIIKNKLTPVKK